MVPKLWDKPLWERVWPHLDPWDSVRLLECPREAWTAVLSQVVEFGPGFSAETVKTCALIGLHVMAEENVLGSDRDSSDLTWEKCGVWMPKKSGLEWRRL